MLSFYGRIMKKCFNIYLVTNHMNHLYCLGIYPQETCIFKTEKKKGKNNGYLLIAIWPYIYSQSSKK